VRPRYASSQSENQHAAHHHGNGTTCIGCGAPLMPKRGSRRQRYCSNACRQSAFRAKKWVERYKIPDPLRSVENNGVKSKACKGDFRDRAPLELLGHSFRWPGAARPGRAAVIRNIIDREIGGAAQLPLFAYRDGNIPALRVRSIGEAAKLSVKPNGVGLEPFRAGPQDRSSSPPIAPKLPSRTGTPGKAGGYANTRVAAQITTTPASARRARRKAVSP